MSLQVARIAAALLYVVAVAAAAEQFEAKVIGVADGDTLTVLREAGASRTSWRIRVAGIDAPEKAQPFGNVARQQLNQLAFGKRGALECRAVDRYDRKVCLVRVDGVDVGLRMIELGLAWHFKRYANTQPRDEAASYAMAEQIARAARVGLWRDVGTASEPIPPWDWRKEAARFEVSQALSRPAARRAGGGTIALDHHGFIECFSC